MSRGGEDMASGGEREQLTHDVIHPPALDLADSTRPTPQFINIYCQGGFLYPLRFSDWGPAD